MGVLEVMLIVCLSLSIVSGWFRDYFGNYKVSFVYMGLCMTCGSVLSYVAGTLAARKRITNERSPHNTKI